MEKYELSPLQKKLLDMLRWFDQFCRDNNLNYYLLGGTMLGAARHQGFIPWDDDIDVGLFREDYEKFITLMENSVKENKYIVEAPNSKNDDFCYPYAKIYDISTTLIENYNIPLKRGIFIDVFPLDYLGNGEKDCKVKYKPIKNLYNFYLSRVASISSHRSWYKNFAILLLKNIPFINNRQLRIKLDKKCNCTNKVYTWGGNLLGNWGLKEIMPVSIIGKPKLYNFENLEVYGVENYDEYLTYLYGNWRKLPPKEKQVTHHDFLFLDLNNSYKKKDTEG